MSPELLLGCQKYNLTFRVFYVLLLCLCRHVKGVAELSPSPVAPVCQEGDQLELICNTTLGIDHRWQFTVFPENVSHTAAPVSSVGASGIPMPLMIGNSMITFSRLSHQNVLPLISMININSVTSDLNGTVVDCFEPDTGLVATTTIQIIDSQLFELSIRSDSEDFSSSDRVTVTLEWMLLNYYQQFLYNISVSANPQPKNVMFTGDMRVQLTLSYNTLYNVSVTQHSTCRQLTGTTILELNFINCGDPMELTNALARDYMYVGPALEGQNITFTCPPHRTLNGSNSSTCMGNGEWEPDPREVQCTESTVTTNMTIQPTDCMPQDTCSELTASTPQGQNTLGIVIGVIFGILAAMVMIIAIAILIFIVNKKGILKHSNDTRNSRYLQDIELDTHGDNHNSKDEGTLVYADIGQRPAPTKSKINTHLLDDNRVDYALLDHFAHEQKAQESSAATNRDTETDNCPNVNLDSLLIQLRPQVGPKWYQFGEAAGIEKEALDKIIEQCQTPDECIVELFDHWLRMNVNPPTWKTVADVLKAINLTELGMEIEKVYVTGTLPIVVDMNQVPKLESQEEEPPPPLPARSENLYIDTPLNTGSQSQNPRVPPPPSNEVPAPALPPKPPRMKLVGMI